MVGLFVGGLVWTERAYLYRDSRLHAAALAESLAVSSLSWVLANDVAGLQEVLYAFQSYPELRYAMIVANNGRVLAHTSPANIGRFVADEASVGLLTAAAQPTTLADDASSVDVAVPVMFEARPVGWARIRLGRGQIAEKLDAMLSGSALFLLAATAMSLLAALAVSQRLGRRVFALAQVTEQVRAGQREVRAPIQGSDEIAGLACAFNDMLDSLADSEQRFRALFEQAAVGVAQVETATGRFVRINQRFCEIVGYTKDEMLASNFQAITLPEDLQASLDSTAALVSGKLREYSLEKRYRRKDGGIVWVYLTVSALWAEGETPNYHVAVVQDITAKVEAQAELLRLNQELERRVQQETLKSREKDHLLIQQSRLAAMGEMVHNIAHQWRQPLNALSIIIGNIQDDYDYGELTADALEQAVSKSRRLLERMSTTVDDFRDFFRPDREPCDFDLSVAVEDAVFIIGDSLKNNGIALEKHLAAGLVCHGYPNQFAQIVLNVLVNAKDAILEQKIGDGRIDLCLVSQDNEAILSIADNAGGIAEDVLPKIFDPYFTTKDQGSGIGLYMAKMIMERNMRGHITATNQQGGALFTLRVPLAAAET